MYMTLRGNEVNFTNIGITIFLYLSVRYPGTPIIVSVNNWTRTDLETYKVIQHSGDKMTTTYRMHLHFIRGREL